MPEENLQTNKFFKLFFQLMYSLSTNRILGLHRMCNNLLMHFVHGALHIRLLCLLNSSTRRRSELCSDIIMFRDVYLSEVAVDDLYLLDSNDSGAKYT